MSLNTSHRLTVVVVGSDALPPDVSVDDSPLFEIEVRITKQSARDACLFSVDMSNVIGLRKADTRLLLSRIEVRVFLDLIDELIDAETSVESPVVTAHCSTSGDSLDER